MSETGENFDTREIQLLTELVEKNIEIINSKFSNNVTNEKKKKIWDKHHYVLRSYERVIQRAIGGVDSLEHLFRISFSSLLEE